MYIYISLTFQRSKLCSMTVEYETFKKDTYLVSHNIVTYKSTITLNIIKHSDSTINMEHHSSTCLKCMNIKIHNMYNNITC